MAVTAYGESLEPIELPEPTLDAGMALIEILTCGVCATDVKTIRGRLPFSDRLELPHVPGHEIYGRVLRTEPTDLLEAGMHAIVYQYWPCGRCDSCRRGVEVLCDDLQSWIGFMDDGGFRERIAVPVERLIPVPRTIDPIHGAPLSCALGSAYRATITRGGARPGSTVAVIGLGGVGIHIAQIAVAAGANVVGFDIHEPTLEVARGLSLDVYRADDDEAVAGTCGAMGGSGVDLVLDTVALESSITLGNRLLRRGGRFVAVGHSAATAIAFPSQRVVLDELELIGSRYASRDEMARVVALVASGRVEVVVGSVVPLEEADDLIAKVEEGTIVGRGVVDVAGVGTPR
jgi:D-arabinose 1-dehydrogenase-like Zn-dependent alcohol dehydrogenase